MERAKNNSDLNNFEYINDAEFLKITEFCSNTNMAIKILSRIMNLIPELRGPRADE